VQNGHTCSVSVGLSQRPTPDAIIDAWRSFRGRPQELDLPSAPPPEPEPLALVRRVLDGLSGQPGPDSWDGTEYALKGTGRAALTAADRAQLGTAADRYPLFG